MHYKISIPVTVQVWSESCHNHEEAEEKGWSKLASFLRAQGFTPGKLEFGKMLWTKGDIEILDEYKDTEVIDTEQEDSE